MSQDLSLFLALVIPGALVGGAIGLLLRRYRRKWCERYAATTSALPWWAFAGFAIFFVILAIGQFATGRPAFGTGFAVLAGLDLIAMMYALFRRVPPDGPTT